MIEPGTPAPDFTLPDQEGEDVSLSSFRGSPARRLAGSGREDHAVCDLYGVWAEKSK